MSVLDVTVEVSAEDGSAVIRCGACGAEQLLWATNDITAQGVATAFMDEHVRCTTEVQAAFDDLLRDG
jgi:hypothetical protein